MSESSKELRTNSVILNEPKPEQPDFQMIKKNALTSLTESFKKIDLPTDNQNLVLPTKLCASTGSLFTRYQKQKLGHRKVDEHGHVTFKTIETSKICEALQIGIRHLVGRSKVPERDVLMKDFVDVEVVEFPMKGSDTTDQHDLADDFKFKAYAPNAFRYFRELFGIPRGDFLTSICDKPLRELSNPGASGSVFYKTVDDRFVIKTVTQKESHFLRKLLSKYFMNLHQNPDTLLPKFYGLYCHIVGVHRVRVVVMNNLLPSKIHVDLKFDLKGSSHKRKANETELSKKCPTLKDLDFVKRHPKGIFLEPDTYESLMKTIKRDCTVLESFNIMDYSFLIGIHLFERKNEDNGTSSLSKSNASAKTDSNDCSEKKEKREKKLSICTGDELMKQKYLEIADEINDRNLKKNGQNTSQRNDSGLYSSTAYTEDKISRKPPQPSLQHRPSTMSMFNQQIFLNGSDQFGNASGICTYLPPDVISGRTSDGRNILLFCGIIDILQSYEFNKKLEHSFKSIISDGKTISVTRPDYYANRFQLFLGNQVFKKDKLFSSNKVVVKAPAIASNLSFIQRKINTPLLHSSSVGANNSMFSGSSGASSSFDNESNYSGRSSIRSVPVAHKNDNNNKMHVDLKKDFRNVHTMVKFNRALEQEMLSRKNNLTLNNAITKGQLSSRQVRLDSLGSSAFDDRSICGSSVFEGTLSQCLDSTSRMFK